MWLLALLQRPLHSCRFQSLNSPGEFHYILFSWRPICCFFYLIFAIGLVGGIAHEVFHFDGVCYFLSVLTWCQQGLETDVLSWCSGFLCILAIFLPFRIIVYFCLYLRRWNSSILIITLMIIIICCSFLCLFTLICLEFLQIEAIGVLSWEFGMLWFLWSFAQPGDFGAVDGLVVGFDWRTTWKVDYADVFGLDSGFCDLLLPKLGNTVVLCDLLTGAASIWRLLVWSWL